MARDGHLEAQSDHVILGVEKPILFLKRCISQVACIKRTAEFAPFSSPPLAVLSVTPPSQLRGLLKPFSTFSSLTCYHFRHYQTCTNLAITIAITCSLPYLIKPFSKTTPRLIFYCFLGLPSRYSHHSKHYQLDRRSQGTSTFPRHRSVSSM